MKALARTLAAAAALAALSILPAGAAHAASPQIDQRNVDRQHATQLRHGKVWRCNSGHGPQVDCRDTASLPGSQPNPGPAAPAAAGRGGLLVLVRSVALLGLLVALAAGADWLRRHHRPREAI